MIAQRLGNEPDPEIPPRKPKWMRTATYDHLLDVWHEAAERRKAIYDVRIAGRPFQRRSEALESPQHVHRRFSHARAATGLHGPWQRSCRACSAMSRKAITKEPLSATIKEHWSDKLELGGSTSGYVACYAANQVLATVLRGSKEDADTKQIRDSATLSRVSGISPRDVVEAMLAAQMVATHEAAMECFRRAFEAAYP
jgi:hypothetical protein